VVMSCIKSGGGVPCWACGLSGIFPFYCGMAPENTGGLEASGSPANHPKKKRGSTFVKSSPRHSSTPRQVIKPR
jgi:hypothetical protein